MTVQSLPQETGNCASLLTPAALQALSGRRKLNPPVKRSKVLLAAMPVVGTAIQGHGAAQNKGDLGSVGKLNTFVPMVSVLQIPTSARPFNLYKNLMLIRGDG